MRSEVSDTPRHATIQWPQSSLMVAGVRSFLAPLGRPGRHYGAVTHAFDGSRLIDPTRVFHVFSARGTYRLNACFYSATRRCATASASTWLGADSIPGSSQAATISTASPP